MSRSYEAARAGLNREGTVGKAHSQALVPKLPKERASEMELKDEEALRGYLGLDDSSNEGLLGGEDPASAASRMAESGVAGMSSEMQDD